MADIELVIKISEEVYNRFGYEYSEENLISKYTNDAILDAFCNGTPLPKGHGDLIDVDDIRVIELEDSLTIIRHEKGDEIDVYIDAPTIIEADKAKRIKDER